MQDAPHSNAPWNHPRSQDHQQIRRQSERPHLLRQRIQQRAHRAHERRHAAPRGRADGKHALGGDALSRQLLRDFLRVVAAVRQVYLVVGDHLRAPA